MPEHKHTPGPWRCDPEDDLPRIGVYAGSGDDVIICDVTDEDLSSLALERMAVHGELEANARLIAAAPDLLEACEAMVKMYVALGMDTPSMPEFKKTTVERARAAIAKATEPHP